MRHDTALADDDITEELVQPVTIIGMNSTTKNNMYSLLIVTNCQLQVTGDNTLLLVVTRRVARKLQNLSSKVLKHRREVDYTRAKFRDLLQQKGP